MKSDSSDHPSVMFQVPSPWSLVLGLAGLMCQVLVPRSRCKGLGRTMPQVSGLMSQVLGPRFQAPGSKSLVPGPKSRVHQCQVPAPFPAPSPSLRLLDRYTDYGRILS